MKMTLRKCTFRLEYYSERACLLTAPLKLSTASELRIQRLLHSGQNDARAFEAPLKKPALHRVPQINYKSRCGAALA